MSIAMTVVLPAPVASFKRETLQLRVSVVVRGGKVFEYAFPRSGIRRDLGKPDRSLDSFDLTKERAEIVKLVMTPVLQQSRCFGGDVRWRREASPLINFLPHAINDRGGVVLLFLSGKSLALVENDLLLIG